MTENAAEIADMEVETLVQSLQTITRMKLLWRRLDEIERESSPLTASQEMLVPSH